MDIQELQNQLTEELKKIEEKFETVKSRKEAAEQACEKADTEVFEHTAKLTRLESETNKMPYKNFDKIFQITNFISFSITAALCLFYSQLIKTPLLQIADIALRVTLAIGLSISSAILFIIGSLKLTKIITTKLQQKSYNKIIESEEYQQKLQQIKELEKELSLSKDIRTNNRFILEDATAKFNVYTDEINKRKAFIEYINHIFSEQKYDEIVEERGRSRKLEKNHNQ